MTTPTPEPLPGLAELDQAHVDHATPLALAIRRTVTALDAAGHVAEKDAARLQLALTMADIIDAKQRSGRLSTVGMDARVLMDLLDGIVGDAEGIDDQLQDAIAAWSAAQDAEGASP